MLDTLVVGAGLSGLTIAHQLKTHHSLLLTEAQSRVGGNITSQASEGFIWEEGPTSFQPTPPMLQLAVELGLRDELVFADRHLPRYVYWQEQLLPIPMTPGAALATPLLSTGGKLRAVLGALGFAPSVMVGYLRSPQQEETVEQFVSRHLGQEVAERLISPFVSGVYAGDVNALSMAAAFRKVFRLQEAAGGGALLMGAIISRLQRSSTAASAADPNLPKVRPGELGSFRQGLKMLPEAIAAKLSEQLRLQWRLTDLQPIPEQTPSSGYVAQFETPEGSQTVTARTVVLATPAHVSSQLLQAFVPAASEALGQIFYPPVACVVLAYPKTALKRPLDGFGNLIPRGQGVRTLGTIWSSSLFPGRCPEDWCLLTSFIGGATDPALGELDEGAIAQAVHQDLSKILVAPESQPKVIAVHLWPRAIPQYELGHGDRLAQIDAALKDHPGLMLCSNFTDGVALGDCIRRGQETAAALAAHLAA
ncbi:MAG: protoporphyrinogen oxidase [Cyanobacteria bacterium P01_G01_bin.54]